MLTDSWFYQPELHQGPLLHGHHDHTLMVVSILIAIAASWLGLQVAGLARKASTTFTRQGALLSGAIALGGGIWAMPFIGMLAFTLPLQVDYDRGITLLSMVPAMAASLALIALAYLPVAYSWRASFSVTARAWPSARQSKARSVQNRENRCIKPTTMIIPPEGRLSYCYRGKNVTPDRRQRPFATRFLQDKSPGQIPAGALLCGRTMVGSSA
mgnify:CR=1 FL=1